jgi:nitroreductase
VIRDKAKREELAHDRFSPFLRQAPVVVAACADPKRSGSHNGMDYYLVDVGISMEHLVLAATDLGLGTCWIGGFDEPKVKKTLGVPNNMKVVALTPLGYPADERPKSESAEQSLGNKKRKPLDEMVHRDKW